MMTIRTGLLFILFTCSFIVQNTLAQEVVNRKSADDKAVKWFDKAVDDRKGSDFDSALKNIDKAIQEEPAWIDAYIEKATIQNTSGHPDEAISTLKNAVAIDSFYEPGILYSIARLYIDMQEYTKAEPWLSDYLHIAGNRVRERERLELVLRSLPWRAGAVAHPVDYQPENLGPPINTNMDEALPSFSVDGNTMVFTRRMHGQEDLYFSHAVESQWAEPGPMDFNTSRNEAAHTIAADGRTIIYTGCNLPDGYGSCDLYISILTGNGWSRPNNIGEPVNTPGWESQPSLSSDGSRLYFSSDRPGGYGGRDIWVASKDGNGEWQKPVVLDSIINTRGNEESPFLHFDGQTLYFMSNGHIGMGDYDLYLSRATAVGWTGPHNLGYPINTPGREGALTVHPNGIDAYYTSDKLNLHNHSLRKDADIYRFTLDEAIRPSPVTYVKGRVTDLTTDQPVAARVNVFPVNVDSSLLTKITRAGEEGNFIICLANGVDYGLHVTAPGYIFFSEQFRLTGHGEYSSRTLDVKLHPLPALAKTDINAEPVVLNNVYFAHGSSEIKPGSDPELRELLSLLRENPDLHLQLRGHTDSTGSPETNMELSQARADAIKYWLVDHGMEEDRLEAKGFGETTPVASNETEEGRRLNRRTEFIVIGNRTK